MVNVKEQRLGKNVRMSFSKTKNTIDLPNLVEIQTQSFKWLLEKGLDEVLHEVSPITDFSGNLSIEFLSYSLDSKPKYSVEECKDREANYAAPLKVNVRLTNKQTGEVKQTDIFMGEFPIMTETGTFVINGAERVIVSQIVVSPGMYYASAFDKSGKKTYTAQVIPSGTGNIESGMPLRIASQEYILASVEEDEYGRAVAYAEVNLPDGNYDAEIVTDETKPIAFLLQSK